MAPKHITPSIPKKSQSPMKQSILSFKATKRSASSSKTKGHAKGQAPVKPSHSESKCEHEGASKLFVVEDSGSEDDLPKEEDELDMRDTAGNYKEYYKEVKEKMGWIRPCELPFLPIQLSQNQPDPTVHAE